MKKKKYKKKKKKSLLKFLKEYAAVITIGMTILAFLSNGIINYYKKASSTEFYFHYLSLNIDDENFIKNYQKEDYAPHNHKEIVAPTINNEINKLLYKYPDKTMSYFITYLIIEQTSEVQAEDISIKFKQYGSAKSLKNTELSSFPISEKQNKGKIKTKKIQYPFPKGETLKIPISICKNRDEFTTDLKDCYYIKIEPISIEYKNKYLFSKRNVPIRGYIEHDVIIDGELVTGKGGIPLDDEKEWYLK